jgi:hypothetical protein
MTPDEEAIADVIGQSIRIALPKQLLPIIERLARLEQKFDQLDARGPLGERVAALEARLSDLVAARGSERS